jgi:RHS repeat-associated protein
VRDLANSAGAVQDHLDYNPFGRLVAETNASFGDRYKWTGRELDANGGLQYNRARYYDSNVGRWTSEDPIKFDAGDPNLSRYVRNNPLNLTDPFGLQEGDRREQQEVWATEMLRQMYEKLIQYAGANRLREASEKYTGNVLEVRVVRDLQHRAEYDPINNEIRVRAGLDLRRAWAALIYELTRAGMVQYWARIEKDAARGKYSREAYVVAQEKLSHYYLDYARKTFIAAERAGIIPGKVGQDNYLSWLLRLYPDFNQEYLKVQEDDGHSDAFRQRYDDMKYNEAWEKYKYLWMMPGVCYT